MLEHIRNMKLRARLLLSYAVIIVICLAASIAALFMLNKIGNNLSSFYNNNYTATVNVWIGIPEKIAGCAVRYSECHIRFGHGRYERKCSKSKQPSWKYACGLPCNPKVIQGRYHTRGSG